MADEIIEELWKIKDDIAREHGYDIRRLGAHLRSLEGRTVEDYLRELKAETPQPRLAAINPNVSEPPRD